MREFWAFLAAIQQFVMQQVVVVEGATEEGMEKTADDEEAGCCGRAETDEGMNGEGMNGEGMNGEGMDEEALIDCSDSRGGRGSWDC